MSSEIPSSRAAALALPPPPGQHIALARDEAFSFTYPHILKHWRDSGAELSFFSPLADAPPDSTADVIWLPGGYPELHAGRLAAAQVCFSAIRSHAETRPVHGECGGYMVLGKQLIDKDGKAHDMLGLLGLVTSMQTGNSIWVTGWQKRSQTAACLAAKQNGGAMSFITARFLISLTRRYFLWLMLKEIWCLKQGLCEVRFLAHFFI